VHPLERGLKDSAPHTVSENDLCRKILGHKFKTQDQAQEVFSKGMSKKDCATEDEKACRHGFSKYFNPICSVRCTVLIEHSMIRYVLRNKVCVQSHLSISM
jgi:hypothetical protein